MDVEMAGGRNKHKQLTHCLHFTHTQCQCKSVCERERERERESERESSQFTVRVCPLPGCNCSARSRSRTHPRVSRSDAVSSRTQDQIWCLRKEKPHQRQTNAPLTICLMLQSDFANQIYPISLSPCPFSLSFSLISGYWAKTLHPAL